MSLYVHSNQRTDTQIYSRLHVPNPKAGTAFVMLEKKWKQTKEILSIIKMKDHIFVAFKRMF